jgi:poly(hydroxyalkanoate) granule-associated protein
MTTKKLKELAEDGGDTQLAAMVRDSATQIWLAGLGAFSKAQEEGTKIFEALVKEGEKVQARGTKQATDKIAEVRDMASGTLGKLEEVFEKRVAQALHTLSVPTKKDIDGLSKRIAELTAVADKLSSSMAHQKHEHR